MAAPPAYNENYTWTPDNLVASMSDETYLYDADGEQVAETVGVVTTVYLQGLWEQTVGGASTRYYPFNGQVVAMRDSATNAVTYLHGDHLGSVSLATDNSGAVVSKQDFDPWGKARGASTIAQTSLNYTGQRLDGTGLLYYHARYYDPALARFVSADSVVPGAGALKGLTVDFHETGFVAQIAGENGQPFWFQMSNEQRQQAGSPWGPANPQALNRYSYVQNNPVKYTDPSGHAVPCKEKGCRTRVDVSSWPDALKKVVAFGCVLFGCEINDSALIGPSPENIISEAMPIGMVGGAFKHAWIKRELFGELKKLVGEADLKKFVAALDKGVVGSYGESGIKILRESVNGYTHELKIGGSAQRLLGKINDAGILIFDRFIRGGLH